MTDRASRPRRSSIEFQGALLEQVPVRIGDIRVASDSSMLFTVGLGSCVAIALYDPVARVGGLAHAMLPHPTSVRPDVPAGRFAVTAVPELLRLVEARGASRGRLLARVAGGASMFRDVLDGDGLKLGRRNVEAALEALGRESVVVTGRDVFGTYGRSVFLRTTDGKLLVTSVNHDDVYL